MRSFAASGSPPLGSALDAIAVVVVGVCTCLSEPPRCTWLSNGKRFMKNE